MLGPQAIFKQRGQSGAWISDNLPHLATVADEISFLKAVQTDQFNHGPAQLLMHTGSARLGRPSIGAWATYGLGSENSNLPGFVVLTSGGNNPDAGKSVWGNGFLPSVYQGVQCRSEGDPVLFLKDPAGIDRDLRKASIDAINEANQLTYNEFKDPETIARMAQYEMAFKMQISVPDVMNINDEPAYIHEMYGTEPGTTSFANNVLLARKLVEKGVRFVQLFDCEGIKVMMTHIGGYPGKYAPNVKAFLAKENVQLFISGHSHILKVIQDKKLNLLHMNPGAAGKQGLHIMRTLIRFAIHEGKISEVEVIEIGKKTNL
jgi:hypothetical protein